MSAGINELTKEDYDRINSYYSLVPHPEHPEDVSQMCVQLNTGPFEGTVIKYGKFQIAPPDYEGESTAKYEYDIVTVPPELQDVEHSDEEGEKFEYMIGEILVKLLWDRHVETLKEEQKEMKTNDGIIGEDRETDTLTFNT